MEACAAAALLQPQPPQPPHQPPPMTLRRCLASFAAPGLAPGGVPAAGSSATVDGVLAAHGLAELVYPDSVVMLGPPGARGRVLPAAPRPATVHALWKPAKCELNMQKGPLRGIAPRSADPSVGALMPVGRLDKGTTGLLLFTDDGILAKLLLSAAAMPKTYIATVVRPTAAPPTAEQLATLLEGVQLDDGPAKAMEASVIDQREKPLPGHLVGKVASSTAFVIRLVVTIGRYHIVKKLLHAVGLYASGLHREAVGSLSLALGEERRGRWPEDPALAAAAPPPDAAAAPPSCVVIERAGASRTLAAVQVRRLWEEAGGQAASERLQACQLLCRYRHSIHVGAEDARLGAWLHTHHTLQGACYAGLRGSTCHYEHASHDRPLRDLPADGSLVPTAKGFPSLGH